MTRRGGGLPAMVALVALGGGAASLYQTRRAGAQRLALRARISAWELRIDGARTCLLGPAPASSQAAEAFSVRERQAPFDMAALAARCQGVMLDDPRPPEVDAVARRAWAAAMAATEQLEGALSNAARVRDDRDGSGPRATVARRLDDVEGARAALLAAAQLPARPVHGLPRGEPPPQPTVSPPASPRVADSVLIEDSFGGAFLLRPGMAHDFVHPAEYLTEAAPQRDWGVRARKEAAPLVGPLGPTGELTAGTPLPVPIPARAACVGGALDDGHVLFLAGVDAPFFLRNQGRGWTLDPALALDRVVSATTAVDGRCLILGERGGAPRAFIAHGGAPITGLEVPATGRIRDACWTATDAWFEVGAQVIELGAAGPVVHAARSLWTCTSAAAVLRVSDTEAEVCAPGCRAIAELPAPEAVATVIGGELVTVRAEGGLLDVWRGGRIRTFAVDPAWEVTHALPAGERVHVAGWVDTGHHTGTFHELLFPLP